MKWLAATLLLIVLGMWMWILWYVTPPESAEAPLGRPEVNAQKMRLTSEPGVRLTPRAVTPNTTAPAAVVDAAADNRLCARLGPFATAEGADKAGALLSEREFAFERRAEERRSVTGYRVYLPPFASAQAAEAKRRELTRLGFRDHAVIHEPGLNNALSLGLFAVEKNARRHVRDLGARGIKAKMQPLHQSRTVYWLELRAEPQALEPLKSVDWGTTEVSLIAESCPSAPLATP